MKKLLILMMFLAVMLLISAVPMFAVEIPGAMPALGITFGSSGEVSPGDNWPAVVDYKSIETGNPYKIESTVIVGMGGFASRQVRSTIYDTRTTAKPFQEIALESTHYGEMRGESVLYRNGKPSPTVG